VAIPDPDAFGPTLTASVMIEAVEHTAHWRADFLAAVEKLDPIRDVYRLTGAYDFLLRMVVADMAIFDLLYEDLTASIRLRSVSSVSALESVKVSTTLPMSQLQVWRRGR
jgi:Lrp/AsnC family transcriptional regulator